MNTPCPICAADTISVGEKLSRFSGRRYLLRQCGACWFSFIENPWTDYAHIYDDAYYAGRGGDPSVDYRFELQHPERTIRKYEWSGILEIVSALIPIGAQTRWMDFGCGNGGLVRYVGNVAGCDAVGFDEGAIAADVRKAGIPLVDSSQLDALAGSFDVITAVEVIEHAPDPLSVLRQMRRLLKPGGLCFMTTGNAAPFRKRLRDWSYVVPDVHVSFFEPETLALALTRSGFRPEFRDAVPGFDQVIRFKVLKGIGVRHPNVVERALPWTVLSRVVDGVFGVSRHPVGWAV
ncbi:MAG TPA: class I SAM-dependent methyltransferase [Povalibacter sp.]|nr:class I SAM-dependent methyltransferase [Povalibacter sp.]